MNSTRNVRIFVVYITLFSRCKHFHGEFKCQATGSFSKQASSVFLTYNWNRFATAVRIAGESGDASAHGNVIGNVALGVESADAGARVDASIVHAGLVTRTFRVDGALRPARDVRVSAVVRWTAALGAARLRIDDALGVRTARVRDTRSLLVDHGTENRWSTQERAIQTTERTRTRKRNEKSAKRLRVSVLPVTGIGRQSANALPAKPSIQEHVGA